MHLEEAVPVYRNANLPGTNQDKNVDQTEEQPDLPVLTGTTRRRLMAKVDWHVVPCLCIMYFLAFLDR